MLKVSDLTVDYGTTRVVDGFDLELNENEVLTLVGPTGCGKTTILQALAGLIPITAGHIALGDWQTTAENPLPPEKRKAGMVFQDFALFPHLTVAQNVAFKLEDQSKADYWLDLLGMSDFRHAKPGTLSGGQKQRVALARTLAHEPAFVLLDEPLSNLDAALKDSLRWEIRHALKSAQVPAIWVTHDQEEAMSVGDRLGVLDKGQLVQLAKPETCFCQPENRFVARFLGEANFLQGELQQGLVSTSLGSIQTAEYSIDSGPVEILIRPDDLAIKDPAKSGNGTVILARFEGATWLYTVQLTSGESLKVRTNHEARFDVGGEVLLQVIAQDSLSAFPAEDDKP